MIKGISDLDFGDAKRLVRTIIKRMKEEENALMLETEEQKIRILMLEYEKRADSDKPDKDIKKRVDACNQRMFEIEDELSRLCNKRAYFEIQLDKMGEIKTI